MLNYIKKGTLCIKKKISDGLYAILRTLAEAEFEEEYAREEYEKECEQKSN